MKGVVITGDFVPLSENKKAHWHIARYRAGFHSLIKKAMEAFDATLYRFYFTSRRPAVKPYTFAVLFPGGQFERDTIYFHRARFYFISPEPEWTVALMNFLNQTTQYTILETPLKLTRVRLYQVPQVRDPQIAVHTLSPVLVRSRVNEKFYLVPRCLNKEEDPGFADSLKYNVHQVVRALQPQLAEHVKTLSLEPVKCRFTVVKYEKNGQLLKFPGFTGTFILRGTPVLLNFLLSVGLGARRSQGFGTLWMEHP